MEHEISLPYIQTRHRVMGLLDPSPPFLDDIAFSLSHINRFTGHAGPYSVAMHSIGGCLAMREAGLPEEMQRSFLLHDAHEAFIGDMSSPVKAALRTLGDTAWNKLEQLHMKNIRDTFGVDTLSSEVKAYDLGMLLVEADLRFDALRGPGWGFTNVVAIPTAIVEEIAKWSPSKAELKFVELATKLGL